RHTRSYGDWSSDVCSSDLPLARAALADCRVYRARHAVPARVLVASVRADQQEPADPRGHRAAVGARKRECATMDYLTLKWLHVLSSAVLFGTGVGSAFYLVLAATSRDPRAIAVVSRFVVITDWLFIATTAVFQAAS